ncbi:MAG: hypothetical protein KGL95_02170, partial [Patescibacteria group bacterium]|nr:hypothetical protein [Patescibacteria group bacterium]
EYDKGHKDHVSAGNKLTKLYEEVVKRENSDDMNLTAEVLLGHLFASHYTEIRDDLNIRAPSIYVTTTKAYYADAVREGKPIRMNQETLWFKYRTYSYNPKSATHRSYRFPKTVDELISHDMLRHAVHDSNDIVATPDLLKRLMPYQEELAKNVIEI